MKNINYKGGSESVTGGRIGEDKNDTKIDLLDYIDFNLYKRISIEELSNTFHYHKDHIMNDRVPEDFLRNPFDVSGVRVFNRT